MKKFVLGIAAITIVAAFGGIGCARGKSGKACDVPSYMQEDYGYVCPVCQKKECTGECMQDRACDYTGGSCDHICDSTCDHMREHDRMRQDHSAYGCHGQETGRSHHGRHHR